MTLKESYQNAYARKNQAISNQLNTKKATLNAKKKRLQEQGEESLRAAYADYMRTAAAAEQQNRAEGRFGGAADNQKAGLTAEHGTKRDTLKASAAQDIAAVDEQIATATATADKQIADNKTALQQKLDSLAIDEAEKAEKAAQSAAKSAAKSSSKSASGSSSSSGQVSKSQAISLMKMGIYDASFAGILGISDEEVRAYIKGLGKKKTATQEGTRLPGTYKPPLQ